MRLPRFGPIGFLVVLGVLGACADDSPQASSAPSPLIEEGVVFDRVIHVVLEADRVEFPETVTVIAHVCRDDEATCPDGSEDLIAMASYFFAPHQIHIEDPEIYLDPPEACLAEDTTCVLSVTHCEFDDVASQSAVGHCVAPASQVESSAADRITGGRHRCLVQRATYSHHLDHACLREGAPS